MTEIYIADLIKAFKRAVIINMDNRTIMVIKEGKLKVYPKKYYNELLTALNLMDFEDDTEGR